MTQKLEILGIGNAILDVLSYADDKKLDALDLKKGVMSLIDETTANALYAKTSSSTECSGGSTANTIAALANLGVKTGFIGKVRNDQLGDIFRHDLQSLGVAFHTKPSDTGASTARCLVYVTPDAQRTMATYLGACVELRKSDIDVEQVANADITYAEGYLWDGGTIEALEFAFATAKKAGKKTAFTLSDIFCVARHREAFLKLASEVDILFANEAELLALFETSYFEEAVNALSNICNLAAITKSSEGATVVTKLERINVPTEAVKNLVDTTGAGDLFAAGFLYGQVKGWGLVESATLGNKTAGHIIQQLGARSQKSLGDLIEKAKAA
jgi:sugar/nucleoside kinase (ribokinase family)